VKSRQPLGSRAALRKGDTNNNGKIEVTELAAYVEGRVPELFAELKPNGGVVKGVTVAAYGAPGLGHRCLCS
jgi:hypothetical protein